MANIKEILEPRMGQIERVIGNHYRRKAKRRPAPVLPKGEWKSPAKPGRHFTVGISRQEIVPDDIADNRYYIAGYYGPKTITGVHDPVCATAIWLDDNAGMGAVAFVSIDCIGFSRHDVDAVRARMAPWARRVGCREIHFFATHTHAGVDTLGLWGKLPKSGRDKKFIELMVDRICAALEAAYETRRCGDLFLGKVEEPAGYHDDYRLPEVYCTTLTRLRFEAYDGGAPVFLVNYAAHPGMMGADNTEMSADWVHWFREDIRKATGGEVIFINGLIGGLVYPHEEWPEDRLASTELAGHRIAELALAVSEEQKLAPKIGSISQDIYIPCDNTLLTIAGMLRILPAKMNATGEGAYGLSVKTSLHYFEIGALRMLSVPGEMFPELAYGGYLPEEAAACGCPSQNPQPLLEIADDPGLVMLGLGNDELGYIIPPNDFFLDPKTPYFVNGYDHLGRKHYEETVGVGVRAAPVIAETFREMLKQIKA